MIKNNMNNKKYKEALDQIQNTLQHQETIDLIIEIFISVAVVKFPDLAAWIISLLSGK